MLIAHKIIEGIKAGHLKTLADDASYAQGMLISIPEAEKFDFGELAFEIMPDTTYRCPELTGQEVGFWLDNLIPLPARLCWYEFSLQGHRSGVLLSETENGDLRFRRADWEQGMVILDGCTGELSRVQTLAAGVLAGTLDKPSALRTSSHVYISDHSLMSLGGMCVWLTLMLHSRTTERVRESAPSRLNAARVKRGKGPLFDHLIVTVVPDKFVDRRSGQNGDGQHASPRLHWRMSHLRMFDHPTASSKPYRDKHAVVIPRCLVGKAELGEITHDYRVKLT